MMKARFRSSEDSSSELIEDDEENIVKQII